MQSLGPITLAVDEELARLSRDVDDPDLRSQVSAIRGSLGRPLRVAVAGRVKAGKSTLVNALLRQRVAPTDVGECTRLVTWYSYGVPERVEVVLRDGTRSLRALQPDGSLPPELGIEHDLIERLEVSLSIDALQALTIIDTPGLQSANDSLSRRTRELLAIDQASRQGVADADVLLLVMALEPHQDDIDTLSSFDAQFGGLRRNALNAVGVLSRIDHLGVGPEDVTQRARDLAARFSDRHHLSLAGMIPVNGLLAETTRCGVLAEQDAEALRRLGTLDPTARRLLLLSADRFVEGDAPTTRSARLRLLTLLDLHGIELSLDHIERSGGSGADLRRHLHSQSGVERLATEVFDHFGRRADAFKAGAALASLHQLLSHRGADRARIVDATERLALDPQMMLVEMVRIAQQVASGEADLPEDLAAEVVDVVTALIGSDTEGSPYEGTDRWAADPMGAVRRWRAYANTGRAGPHERRVAEAMLRAYESIA